MIATGGRVDLGRASEFTKQGDQSGVEQTAFFEVVQQGCDCLIEFGQAGLFLRAEVFGVSIPFLVVGEIHEREVDARFGQAAGQDQSLGEAVVTVLAA